MSINKPGTRHNAILGELPDLHDAPAEPQPRTHFGDLGLGIKSKSKSHPFSLFFFINIIA